MIFLKDNLASQILLHDRDQLSDMQEFARNKNYPNFEVRTVGSAGTVQIKFPHQDWIKPREWAENHRTTILNNLYSDLKRAENLDTIKSFLKDEGYFHKSELKERLKFSINEGSFIEQWNAATTWDEVYDIITGTLFPTEIE